MNVRNVARATVAAGAAIALSLSAAPAQASQERPELIVLCDQYIDIQSIQIPGFVNCTLDYTGNYVQYLGQWTAQQLGRIGNCVFYYDPLFAPFPNNIAPETVQLATCVA
ncbi:MAG TPA: hypothetical protein VNA20_14630 [Frankiaceae bacterium]|nr:hypothetical protein [Frankiaceae bacterium]